MYQHTQRWRAGTSIFLLAAALLAAMPAFAQEPAGRVLVTKGTVTATDRDDFERSLSRNDVVYPGETLNTGPGGRLQVRFLDEGLVDLRPNTQFEIERYRESTQDEGGSAVMNLFKGALRTITGAIGHGEEDEYAVETPVATIGIRGTDYSLEFCDTACTEAGEPPGLYGRIDDGQLSVANAAGTGAFGEGDYFFVEQGGTPQRIIAPPTEVLVDDEGEQSEGSSAEEDEGAVPLTGQESEEGPSEDLLASNGEAILDVTDDEYEANESQSLSEQLDIEAVDVFGAFVFPTTLIDDEDAVRGGLLFPSDHPLSAGDTTAYIDDDGRIVQIADDSHSFTVSNAEIVNTGRVTSSLTEGAFAVDWGRWSGDYVFDDESLSGDFAYAYTEDLTDPADMPATETDTFFSYAGGPGAIDSSGNLWDIDTLSMTVNFANAAVSDFDLDLSQDGANPLYFDGTDGRIDDATFRGPLTQVEGEGDGYYIGGFLGGDASGAMLIFHVDTDDHVIDGIGVLEEEEPVH